MTLIAGGGYGGSSGGGGGGNGGGGYGGSGGGEIYRDLPSFTLNFFSDQITIPLQVTATEVPAAAAAAAAVTERAEDSQRMDFNFNSITTMGRLLL